MKRKIQLAVCILVSAVALWITFWLGGISFADVAASITKVQYLWTIPFVGLTLLSMYFRVMRWQCLLRPSVKLSANQLLAPIFIGFALNCLLPARVGEFARAYVLKKNRNVAFSLGFGTIVLERVFDMMTLIFFMTLMLWTMPEIKESLSITWDGKTRNFEGAFRGVAAVMALGLCGSLALLSRKVRMIVESLLRKLPMPRGMHDKVVAMFHSFSSGMDSLRNPKLIAIILFHSLMVWVLVAVSLQVMYLGLKPLMADFTPISFMQGMSINIIICVAIMIPAAPGYWGLYEAGVQAAFSILGLTPDGSPVPMTYSLIIHAFQMVPIIIIGVVFMSRQRLSFKEVLEGKEKLKENA
ncbi:flippase-like domain-containing protein [Candidatus Sumerlaeota bacterium]|nr:flippase-like domain-containing protein [Candidatus Sumerlaeota bacterium]